MMSGRMIRRYTCNTISKNMRIVNKHGRLLLDDKLLNLKTDETNRYAKSLLLSAGTMYHSPITRWLDVTSDEMLGFIGLVFHSGTIKSNKIQDYWKTHWLFGITSFSK